MADLQPTVFKFRAMGGENELLIYCADWALAQSAADDVIIEAQRIEQKFSRYREDSVVSRINSSAGLGEITLDEETASLVNYAQACYHQSGGLFDITSGVLRRVWNFHDGSLPKPGAIEALLPLVGWKNVSWKCPVMHLRSKGMELDFGGIGKEYAVDRAASILVARGLRHSLINFAGDIRVCGPHPDGAPWNIGISDPRDGKGVLGVIQLSVGAVATSGDYERAIVIEGKRYSHLLNPRTGWPAQGLQSATVLAESCVVAGSVTTSAMLQGKGGERYLSDLGLPYVCVTSEGKVKSSQSMAGPLRTFQLGAVAHGAYESQTQLARSLS